jgi:hypothetical protein
MNHPFSVRSTFNGTDAVTAYQVQQRIVAEATAAGVDMLARVTERATNDVIETIASLPRGVRLEIERAALSAHRLQAAARPRKNACSCDGAGAGGSCECGGRKCACKGRGMFRRTAGGQWITADVCEDGRCCDYL